MHFRNDIFLERYEKEWLFGQIFFSSGRCCSLSILYFLIQEASFYLFFWFQIYLSMGEGVKSVLVKSQ